MICKPSFHLPVLHAGMKKEPEDFSDSHSYHCLEEGIKKAPYLSARGKIIDSIRCCDLPAY